MVVLKSGPVDGPIGQPTLLELMRVGDSDSTPTNQAPMVIQNGRDNQGDSGKGVAQQKYNRPSKIF